MGTEKFKKKKKEKLRVVMFPEGQIKPEMVWIPTLRGQEGCGWKGSEDREEF